LASTEEISRADDVERLTLLVEASGKLLATLDLEAVLPQVLGLAERVLAADAHALWQRDPATDEWSLLSVANLSREYQQQATEAVRGGGAGVSYAGPIVAEDIATTAWLTRAHREAHAREGNRAFVAMPLVHRGDVIGTLTFYYRHPLQLSDADMRAAAALADLAAAAIGTASLYETQRRLADERRLVAEASILLGSSLDVGTTLTNVAQLVVPDFADWCAVDLVGAKGAIERVAVAHVDADKVRLADEVAASAYAAQVRLLDMSPIFTPDFKYRDAMDVDGEEKLVRQSDGIHLNRAGAAIAARVVVRHMRRDGFLKK
jgi:signal transduction protein with GAF and PtsI domain